jgi:Uncharacterized protein conserved in bacteria (DUF2125)
VTVIGQRTRFTGLIIPFFLAACLIAGYWLYWDRAARQIESQVRGVLPPERATVIKVTGFPYRLTLQIKDLNIQAQNGLAFKASSLIATATPFNPFLWVLEGALDPALALPGGAVRPLKAINLKSSIRLSQKGLERFSLTFDGVEAQGSGGWQVGKGLFHVMTRFEDGESFALVTDLTNVRIAQTIEGPAAIMGQTIDHVFISGPIDKRPALMKSLGNWRDVGGKLTIMAGEVIWGPISLTGAKGDLSLSPSNEWQGSLTGLGALKPEGVAVGGLSGPVTLQIRDGRLSLNGLPGINMGDAFR